jgi:ABC-type transport system substrate-binding protein
MMKVKLLLLLAMSVALVGALACGADEKEDTPVPTKAAVQPTAPSGTITQPTAVPTKAAVAPVTKPTARPAAVAVKAPSGLPPVYPVGDPLAVIPADAKLATEQFLTTPHHMYDGGRGPWQDGGRQRIFSIWVYGTLFQIDENQEIRPYIATSWIASADQKTFTVKLREDAIFQDGSPITAADVKAYWEFGAMPENIPAWGGASLTIGDILGWDELKAGDTTEADGIRVIDDLTIEFSLGIPIAAWPAYMAAWHTGLSVLQQIKDEDRAYDNPIGAGPYVVSINPDTATAETVPFDEAGAQFWGPSPNIKKMSNLNVRDQAVQVIMFENGELSTMSLPNDISELALSDPNHPMAKLLFHVTYPGLQYIKNKLDIPPMEDVLMRRALAHGQDMESIMKAVYGKTSIYQAGLMAPGLPCHDPGRKGPAYDPDLARQELAGSTYGSAENLPAIFIDLGTAKLVSMGVAMKEYYKDNLGIELDVVKRETGMPRREGSQFYRISLGSWILDPVMGVSALSRTDSISSLTPIAGGYPVLHALLDTARGMAADDPERCKAYQAVEAEYMDKMYLLPMRYFAGHEWAVQPWVIGFASTSNLAMNRMPWMYVLQH